MKAPYCDVSCVKKYFNDLYGDKVSGQYERYERAFSEFKRLFGEESCYIASSSGRVELLGNHTDHNGGRVLSCAISLDTLAFFTPCNGEIRLFSEGYGEIKVGLSDTKPVKKGTSAALIKGVAEGFKNYELKAGGFNAYVTSSVLNGSGVSSSASFEVLICEIFNFLYNDGAVSCELKAKISQFAERDYFGKPCGLLDQTAIAYGGLNKLDFGDKDKIKVERIDEKLRDYTLFLINTGSSHENLTNEYASIPAEMKTVAGAFGKERLIELDESEFYAREDIIKKLPDRAVARAIHFFDENKRVDRAAESLLKKDFSAFLDCVRESGISSLCKLQNCYVGGSNEQLVPRALFITEKFLNGGANRVHGGGFGGTILNIVENKNAEFFLKSASRFFGKENVIELKIRNIGTIVL